MTEHELPADLREKVNRLTLEKWKLLRSRIRERSGQKVDGAIAQRPPGSHPVLTFAQQRLWFIDRVEEGKPGYNMPAVYTIDGLLDVIALRRAFNEVVSRHEVLRTVFTEVGGNPVPFVCERAQVDFSEVDLSDLTEEAQADEVKLRASRDAYQRFDLSNDVLLRVHLLRLSPRRHAALFNMHHIASDGWSISVLLCEIAALYSAFLIGSESPLRPLRLQYADYASWQRESLLGESLEKLEKYWRVQLRDIPEVHNLPLDKPRPGARTYQGARVERCLAPAQTARLRALCKAEGVTAFMALSALFAILLGRYSNESDIIVGTPVAGRIRPEVEDLIGSFVNMVVLRTDLSGSPSFSQLLQSTKKAVIDALEHQAMPFEMLVDTLQPQRSLSYTPLFQVSFSVQVATDRAIPDMPGLKVSEAPLNDWVAKWDLDLCICDDGNSMKVCWIYSTDLFEADTVERMADNLHVLLEGAVAHPFNSIDALELISDAEKRWLQHRSINRVGEQPVDCIHRLFEAQAERTPNSVAVVCSGRSLTYAELNAEANRLANLLLERGVNREGLVAVLLERSVEMLVSIIGVLKAGAAYVPIDPTSPTARIEFLLRDSGAAHIVTESRHAGRVTSQSETIVLDNPDSIEVLRSVRAYAPRVDGATARDVAYVIYTSGSTGRPKGVVVEHRQVVRLLAVTQDSFSFGAEDVWTLFHSYTFDFSVWEIWGALLHGGRLVIVPHWVTRSPSEFHCLLSAERVTVLNQTPSAFATLMEVDQQCARLDCLRLVIFGGETLSLGRLTQWVQRYGDNQPQLVNMYGITETTVHVTHRRLTRKEIESDSPVSPIGTQLADLSLWLLDLNGRLAPIGVPAEIYVGGFGVARGYHNRPDLTAERFLFHPLVPGQRLYRTGDLGRRRSDGELEYLGRIDHQVKIRGFRIELGEIEAQLLCDVDVADAVVVVREDVGVGKQLVAYVVAASGEARVQDNGGFVARLRARLREVLPDYMVPSAFVVLESIPLTANGKKDRKGLPAPEHAGVSSERYVAPRTPVEVKLCEIWQELLKVDRVGVKDNFFELGGDSIISIQVIARARANGLHLTVRELFEHQSIEELCPYARTGIQVQAQQGEITGELSLLPIQEMFFAQSRVDAHHFNQAVLLETPPQFDMQALSNIIAAIYQRHDVLRVRFRQKEGRWRAVHQPFEASMVSQTLAYEDLSGLPDEKCVHALEVSCNALQGSLNLSEGPLMRAGWFDYGPRRGRLLLVIHHLAVDGVSWRILLADVWRGYQQWCEGQKIALAAKTSSFKQWGAALGDYALSKELGHQRKYWLQQLCKPVQGLKLTEDEPLSPKEAESSEFATFRLSASSTNALLTECNGAYRTQINELLLAALLRAYQQCGGGPVMRVEMEGHGREEIFGHLDTSETIGWFTSIFPLILESASDSDTGTLIKTVKEQCRAVPQRGIGYGVLTQLAHDQQLIEQAKHYEQHAIRFNYLGQFDNTIAHDSPFSLAQESAGRSASSRQKQSHGLVLTGTVVGGALSVSLEYPKRSANMPSTLLDSFERALLGIIDYCQQVSGSYTPSDFPNAQLSMADLQRIEKQYNDIARIYATTATQKGMVYHGFLDGSGASYTNQIYCEIVGHVDLPAFRSAWQQVVARHDVLRTCFIGLGEPQIHQLVLGEVLLPIIEEDWSTRSQESVEQDFLNWRRRDKARGFDFTSAPLLRLALLRTSAQKIRFVWTHHHAVLDGWCLPLIFREVLDTYLSHTRGARSLQPTIAPYENYIRWLQARDIQADRRFWKAELDGLEGPTPIPVMRNVVPEEAGNIAYRLMLSQETSTQLALLASTLRCTMNVVLQAAWAYLLHRYSGESSVVFGATVSGRPADLPGIEQMMGLFIHTVPVRVEFFESLTITQLLGSIHSRNIDREEHCYLGLLEIRKLSAVRGGSELFDSLIVFENYPIEEALATASTRGDGLSVQNFGADLQTPYLLTLEAHQLPSLEVTFRFDPARVARAAVARFASHLECILGSMASIGGGCLVENIAWLPPEERQTIVEHWNSTAIEFSRGNCLHQHFEAQVGITPEACAALDDTTRLSYAELNRSANQLGRYLRAQGVGPDTIVAICLGRSVDLAVAALAILKAGGAYVPIDPGYPMKRIDHMLRESAAHIVLTREALVRRMPTGDHRVLCLDDRSFMAEVSSFLCSNLSVACVGVSPSNIAYVIFTSGSTGKAKGVMVEHRSVVNYLLAMAPYADGTAGCILNTNISFDGSVTCLLLPWVRGGYVKFISDEPEDQLREIVGNSSRHFLKMTPSHLNGLRSLLGVVCMPPEAAKHVIVLGGEAFTRETYEYWSRVLPEVSFINHYGPTETTVGCVTYAVSPEHEPSSFETTIPIGKPLANTCVFVLDGHGDPAPMGVCGELYVGGAGIARGYLGQPGMTAERFVPNPFRLGLGERLYKTGDIVRWQADGNVEFVGRRDHQVKIRGFRIELGEIEAQLLCDVDVADAVVVVREDVGVGKQLVAYVVAASGEARVQDNGGFVARLRARLREVLPDYMVPSAFVVLESIPLTANGKKDRKGLPAPEHAGVSSERYVAPRTPVEVKLCEIWQELLKVDRVGVKDNFFELGGDSIISIQVIARARANGLHLTVRELFEHQSIEELCPYARTGIQVQAQQGEITGELSLLPIQEMFFAQSRVDAHHFNQAVLLETPPQFDMQALSNIIAAIYQRHDVLRVRFRQKEGRWRAVHQPFEASMVSQTLAYEDLSGLPDEKCVHALEVSCNALQGSLNLSEGPLMRAGWFDYGPRRGRLLLVIHHLAVDGVSWRILLADVWRGYQQWCEGQKIALAAKTSSFKQWGAALGDYALSKELGHQRKYWLQQLCKPVQGLKLTEDEPLSPKEAESSEFATFRLSASSTNALLTECNGAYRTQINELLLAALLRAYQQCGGGPVMRVEMEGHGREEIFGHLDTSETIGWFTSIFPLILESASDSDTGTLIKTVKEQCRAVPQRGIGYGVLTQLAHDQQLIEQAKHYEQHAIRFNYLGQFDNTIAHDSPFSLAQESAGRSDGDRESLKFKWVVDTRVINGSMEVSLRYGFHPVQRETAHSLLKAFEGCLGRIVDHCRATVTLDRMLRRHVVDAQQSAFVYEI